jgi:hypothetical protein
MIAAMCHQRYRSTDFDYMQHADVISDECIPCYCVLLFVQRRGSKWIDIDVKETAEKLGVSKLEVKAGEH